MSDRYPKLLEKLLTIQDFYLIGLNHHDQDSINHAHYLAKQYNIPPQQYTNTRRCKICHTYFIATTNFHSTCPTCTPFPTNKSINQSIT